MRFADGPATQVEVTVDAPPQTVWPLVCDIELPARFSEEFQGGEWVVDTSRGPVEGARFLGRNRNDYVGDWQTTSIVFTCEANRSFGWKVNDLEKPAATWRFDLSPAADGSGTVLRQSVVLGPGPSGLTMAIKQQPDKEERIIERRLENLARNMQATIEGIKALAEAATLRQ